MDIITVFKEASVSLQSDPKYLALDAARRALDEDKELQDMIGEFNVARMDLNNEMIQDERDDQKINDLNDKVSKLYQQVMNHPKMMAYNLAKTEAEKLVAYIDEIINTAMNGGDPMQVQEPQSGCSGSCATCGGCH